MTAYKGPAYRVIVDGQIVATFHTLTALRPHQIQETERIYKDRLLLDIAPFVKRHYGM